MVTRHFEKQTGRPPYGLAAHQWDLRSEYESGGEAIERWSLTVPCVTTLSSLLGSTGAFTVLLRRRSLGYILLLWLYHLALALSFLGFAGFYAFNILGVFI